eukprot:GILI01005735.1.p1 GENE.GILI01005735.1~~GILI01005735.1.p1  ORF type:complete len:378 (+),score=71.81 GILI01005735.1:124-1257(+)
MSAQFDFYDERDPLAEEPSPSFLVLEFDFEFKKIPNGSSQQKSSVQKRLEDALRKKISSSSESESRCTLEERLHAAHLRRKALEERLQQACAARNMRIATNAELQKRKTVESISSRRQELQRELAAAEARRQRHLMKAQQRRRERAQWQACLVSELHRKREEKLNDIADQLEMAAWNRNLVQQGRVQRAAMRLTRHKMTLEAAKQRKVAQMQRTREEIEAKLAQASYRREQRLLEVKRTAQETIRQIREKQQMARKQYEDESSTAEMSEASNAVESIEAYMSAASALGLTRRNSSDADRIAASQPSVGRRCGSFRTLSEEFGESGSHQREDEENFSRTDDHYFDESEYSQFVLDYKHYLMSRMQSDSSGDSDDADVY